MRLLVILFFSFMLAVPSAATENGYGSVVVTLVPKDCMLARTLSAYGVSFLTGKSTDQLESLTGSTVVLHNLVPGREFVQIRSGTCVSRFTVGVFAEVVRTIVAAAGRSGVGHGEQDVYTVPLDFAAIRLPFPSMAVMARMKDGAPLSVQIVNQYAFVDDIPYGDFVVTLSGANFWRRGTFHSLAANRSFIASVP